MQREWNLTPQQALAAWPDARPLAALITGAPHPRWGRVSVLAEPRETFSIPWEGSSDNSARRSIDALEQTLAKHTRFEVKHGAAHSPAPMADGLWIVALCYEWGGLFESTAMPLHRAPPDGWPLAVLCWCPEPLIYVHNTKSWMPTRASQELQDALTAGASAATANAPTASATPAHSSPAHAASATITELEADEPRAAFERAVARTVEFVCAGDIFQANIAQRFSARWKGNPRAVARAAFDAAAPRYGAYLETDRFALASMSPELFLEAQSSGAIVTRPVKGTLAQHEDPSLLLASDKDAAELHMIVDLMRNDLGRVCAPGSVHVAEARALESHLTVHHGVAEVCGTLRAATRVTDLLRATFPPGSVTGAPKVRAMQVIDELEANSRGPYCGAVGAIHSGGIALNVGIRTVCMHRDAPHGTSGTLRYSAGCGIVADSVPVREYEESLHKTAVMLHTAHALRPRA